MMIPAATFISQGAAHAVVDQNGEDGVLDNGNLNGVFSDKAFDGDVIQVFSPDTFRSASDIDNTDGGDFDICGDSPGGFCF